MGRMLQGKMSPCLHPPHLSPSTPTAQQTQVQTSTPEQPPGTQAAVPGKAVCPKRSTGNTRACSQEAVPRAPVLRAGGFWVSEPPSASRTQCQQDSALLWAQPCLCLRAPRVAFVPGQGSLQSSPPPLDNAPPILFATLFPFCYQCSPVLLATLSQSHVYAQPQGKEVCCTLVLPAAEFAPFLGASLHSWMLFGARQGFGQEHSFGSKRCGKDDPVLLLCDVLL